MISSWPPYWGSWPGHWPAADGAHVVLTGPPEELQAEGRAGEEVVTVLADKAAPPLNTEILAQLREVSANVR